MLTKPFTISLARERQRTKISIIKMSIQGG